MCGQTGIKEIFQICSHIPWSPRATILSFITVFSHAHTSGSIYTTDTFYVYGRYGVGGGPTSQPMCWQNGC